MNDLIVKPVDVLGDTIMAAKDKDGNIWAGVSWFCRALGMNKKQKDTQTEKVQSDDVLKRGATKFPAGVFDDNNETIALRLDFVPIWLTKISVTPTMKKDHPELADKLLDYQLRAKDILADAFLPKNDGVNVQGQIKLLAQGTTELYQRVETLEERFTKFEDDLPLFQRDTKEVQNAVKKKALEILGGKDSNAYKDKSVRTYVFADIQCQLRRNFDVRRYEEIRHKRIEDALRIVEEYKAPLVLMEKVQYINAQQTLDL